MTTTKTKSTRAKTPARKEAVSQEAASTPVEEIPAESTPQDYPWAADTDIQMQPFKDIVLPVMKRKVRIRVLDNLEAAEVALIPDLARFGELIASSQSGTEQSDAEKLELFRERQLYLCLVAHIVVMKPDADPNDYQPCADCGAEHPPALWTKAQTRRMDTVDLVHITGVAEGSDQLEKARPLLKDQTLLGSSPSADTGE